MENLLRKQLAQIKKRALWLRRRAREREQREGGPDRISADGFDAGTLDATGGQESSAPRGTVVARKGSQEIVDAVVRTGAVVRGSDFERLRTLERRRPIRRWAPGAEDMQHALEKFKDGDPAPLEALVPGTVLDLDGRRCYLVRPVGTDVDPIAVAEAAAFARLSAWPDPVTVARSGRGRGAVLSSGAAAKGQLDPRRVLFLDIETGGLSANTYVFLCGMMFLEDGQFVVEQAFARSYDEEEGLLRHVAATVERFDTVVTYNGASFDLPFLRTRMAIHRLSDFAPFASVDLLYAARRAFRGILPNRRLVTVEQHLRGMGRTGDIPGRFIPDAWHDFVRTGDARVMRNVLYHNRMDIFTMAVLVNRLADNAA